MNYYVDFIPTKNFMNALYGTVLTVDEKSSIVFNVYLKQLPSMNINSLLYCEANECSNIFNEIKKCGYRVNLMFDTFCFGNMEFNAEGKIILGLIDSILEMQPDYVTLTNYFYYNYIKQRHQGVKLIFSEYSEISNIQKIYRYLEELESFGVKIDTKVAKDRKLMEYISCRFPKDSIHIDINKGIFKNNIYSDSLNYNIAHYIQKEKWNEIELLLEFYKKELSTPNKGLITLEESDVEYLMEVGFLNFWYYCTLVNEDVYLNNLKQVIGRNYKDVMIYPWGLVG